MSKTGTSEAREFIQFVPTLEQVNGQPIGWVQSVTHVDTTKTDNQAIEGRFLSSHVETELPVGSILLYVTPAIGDQADYEAASAYRLEADGSETSLNDTALDWKQDFVRIRDLIAEAMIKSFPNDKGRVVQQRSQKPKKKRADKMTDNIRFPGTKCVS